MSSGKIMEIATDDSLMLIYFISIVAMGIMITLIGNCLCCRRNKAQKDEFSGVEGMVKIKRLDEGDFASNTNLNANVSNVIELKLHGNEHSSNGNNQEIKRVTNAPHRSLPDLPAEIGDAGGDNNSDLYATVGDKMQQKTVEKSPSTLKKQTSISQHSSISQADDFSSPYARVRSPPHAYDKVKRAEHPYAQVGSQVGPMLKDQSLDETDGENSLSQRQSNSSLADIDGNGPPRQEIPAASAIAGRISASQDLPYMTPPIVQPQLHFSGDSQDSSKGYTSISVREPLANIIAMTNEQNAQRKRRDMSDSHYATVSDDSDEMYAAIDDPNQIDLYTSGSETYAQIQPPSNLMTVSVEINTTQSQEVVLLSSHQTLPTVTSSIPTQHQQNNENIQQIQVQVNPTPMPPSIDSLKTQMHSRQASASSCSSSLGYIGSPKPEKRQANSPLPPTPKSLHKSSTSNLTSGSSNVTSGRNSAASVIEVSNIVGIGKMETPKHDTKKKSPSKDIEGMYAKVMKKTKLFTNLPANNGSNGDLQLNNNPEMYVSDPDITKEINIEFANNGDGASPGKNSTNSVQIDNNYETIDKKKRHRTGSFTQKDPGYETIPAEKNRNNSRMSAPVGSLSEQMEPGYELLPDRPVIVESDPGYEILKQTNNSDYDPNYEVLRPVDDGYARIMDKTRLSDGYSSIKNVRSKIVEDDDDLGVSPLDGYAKIGDKKQTNINNNVVDETNFYSSITNPESNRRSFPTYATVQEINTDINNTSTISRSNGTLTENSPNYSTISETTITTQKTTPSTESFTSDNILLQQRPSDTGSMTGSDTDPNYESVRYLNVTENPYERLHSEKASPVSVGSSSSDAVKITSTKQKTTQKDVADFFQV